MRRRRLGTMGAAAFALLLASGCASLEPGTGPPPATSTTAPTDEGISAELVIALDETGDGPTETFTLTCVPPGGTHPDPEAACAALARAGGVAAFAPTPSDVACTELYGGPQVATVEGTVDGEKVGATFTRVNGCEISRWDALAPLLGSAGGVD